MVKVEYNLRMLTAQLLGVFHSTLGHIAEQRSVGIVASALGHLENHRRLQF